MKKYLKKRKRVSWVYIENIYVYKKFKWIVECCINVLLVYLFSVILIIYEFCCIDYVG